MYKEKIEQGISHEDIMAGIYAKGRDNARTPMQWTSEGGFTTGTPWIRMNPNTEEINVEQSINDSTSIFYTYQKLIQLRKQHDIITDGSFQLLLADHPSLFVYKRQSADEEWLVVTNFSDQMEQLEWKDCDVTSKSRELIISNYDTLQTNEKIVEIRPYEAFVVAFKKGIEN